MLKNYFLIALRSLGRHKSYSLLNILGLSAGLAACLLIAGYVAHELSFDRFHEKRDRIYRVAVGGDDLWARAPIPAGPMLPVHIPSIETSARYTVGSETLVDGNGRRFYEEAFASVDPEFFEIFDFQVLKGDPVRELAQPFTVFLTASKARQYFGGKDPVGEVLRISNTHDYVIRGVLADVPAHSHLRFDFVQGFASDFATGRDPDRWDVMAYTYVLLHEEADMGETSAAMSRFVADHIPESHPMRQRGDLRFHLTPLTDIRLHARQTWEIAPQSDVRYVYLFSGVAFLILLLACVNYVNLATARSAGRAREVGVRKVIGASRRQLILRFLGESVLFCLLAMGLALAMAELMRPWFSTAMNIELMAVWDARLLPLLFTAAVLVGIAAGFYPAAYLSGYRPIRVLTSANTGEQRRWLRKGLIMFQFTISVVLILATSVLYLQMKLVQQSRPGFGNEHVLILETRDSALEHDREAFRTELTRHPQVRSASGAGFLPERHAAIHFLSGSQIDGADGEETYIINAFNADPFLLETMGIKLLQGRPFTGADDELIINETAARSFGWNDPIGRRIALPGGRTLRVIAVAEDFHSGSLREAIRPAFLYAGVGPAHYMAVRLFPGDLPRALAFVENTWNSFVPDQPILISFLDDAFDALYREEMRLSQLFTGFALLAILIACLGLFGLAAYTAEQRTKEIGIRKVLGATVANVVALLSKDFAKLVLIAALIATPIGYYVMSRWLENFAYRIEISWWNFALAGGIALAIALLTVSSQAVKAAVRNPVEALRYE